MAACCLYSNAPILAHSPSCMPAGSGIRRHWVALPHPPPPPGACMHAWPVHSALVHACMQVAGSARSTITTAMPCAGKGSGSDSPHLLHLFTTPTDYRRAHTSQLGRYLYRATYLLIRTTSSIVIVHQLIGTSHIDQHPPYLPTYLYGYCIHLGRYIVHTCDMIHVLNSTGGNVVVFCCRPAVKTPPQALCVWGICHRRLFAHGGNAGGCTPWQALQCGAAIKSHNDECATGCCQPAS